MESSWGPRDIPYRPRFSLQSVLQANPGLTMDESLGVYLRRLPIANRQEPLGTHEKMLDALCKAFNHEVAEYEEYEENLFRALRITVNGTYIDFNIDDIIRSVQGPYPRANPEQGGTRRKILELDPNYPWDFSSISHLPGDAAGLLARMNATLDKIASTSGATVHSPPVSNITNPFVRSGGTVFLRARLSRRHDPPTYFIVHTAYLRLHSRLINQHLYLKPHERIFSIDADVHALRRAVNWLYYQESYSLNDFDTNRLLALLALACMLRMPVLHNQLVQLLFHRHAARPAGFDYPPLFRPSNYALRSVFEKSGAMIEEEDGAKRLCGFLLARTGVGDVANTSEWEVEVMYEVEKWLEERRRLGEWRKVWVKEFLV